MTICQATGHGISSNYECLFTWPDGAASACRTTTQRKEHKDRVQVTKQYESKIDRIETRLASIEHLLRQSSNASSVSSTAPQTPSTSSTTLWDHRDDGYVSGSKGATAPESSVSNVGLRAESLAATNVFEQIINRDPSVQQDPQISAALDSLRVIVNHAQFDASDPLRGVGSKSSQRSTSSISLPGWTEVRSLLQRIEGSKPSSFYWLPTEVLDDFRKSCRSMYEHGRDGSHRERLLVYAGLANICSEFSAMDQDSEAEYSWNLSRSFATLLLQELATFPLLIPPSIENVEALMLATTTTIGLCKPNMAWNLSCTVIRMCQVLGYNRLSQVDRLSDPMFERKVVLFWGAYGMDRNTSMRLGRAPAIQDYDIDTPMLAPSDNYPSPFIALMRFCVDIGRAQGKISTQIYGPASRSLSPDERARAVEACVRELYVTHERKKKASAEVLALFASQQVYAPEGKCSKVGEMMALGDDIMLYSVVSMALYALPPNHPRLFRAHETARQCLRSMIDVNVQHQENNFVWAMYCHWVLLHTPLTPFTGIFCNIIANPLSSHDDLQLLDDFAASLQPACRLSEGIEKFHQLCAIFVRVAQAYVRAKAQQKAANDDAAADQIPSWILQPAIGEFDEHFTTLGFFPGPQISYDDGEADRVGALDGSGRQQQTEQQQQQQSNTSNPMDWYLGNVSLYNLLEQDLNDLHQF